MKGPKAAFGKRSRGQKFVGGVGFGAHSTVHDHQRGFVQIHGFTQFLGQAQFVEAFTGFE